MYRFLVLRVYVLFMNLFHLTQFHWGVLANLIDKTMNKKLAYSVYTDCC